MMKIAVVIDALSRGGAERQAILTVNELCRIGHYARIVVYHPYREYDELIADGGINVIEIDRKGILRLGRILAMVRHFRDARYDVVHAFGGTAGFYAALAARLARVPVVFGGYRVEYKEKGLVRLAHRLCDRMVDGWIVNSHAIADSMAVSLGIDASRCHVVYNGVPAARFQSSLDKVQAKSMLGIPHACPVVAKVARLHPQKNHRLYLKTAATVLASHPDTIFMVVGDGPLKPDMQKYADTLAISKSVLFTGNRTDVADVLAATDISVLTSDFEGFPNALIEAMSVGIPVVSTDYPGIEELVTDGKEGLIAPRNDHDALASQICRLLDSDNLRHTIGSAGRKMVHDRLSPAKMAENMISVYQRHVNR